MRYGDDDDDDESIMSFSKPPVESRLPQRVALIMEIATNCL